MGLMMTSQLYPTRIQLLSLYPTFDTYLLRFVLANILSGIPGGAWEAHSAHFPFACAAFALLISAFGWK